MRNVVMVVAGLAIAAFGVYLYLQSGARSGEVAVEGSVASIEVFERQSGRAFDLHSHTVTFTDPASDEQRSAETVRYRQKPPRVGDPATVYLDAGTRGARVPAPESRRNAFIAMGFGALLALVSLQGVVTGRSS